MITVAQIKNGPSIRYYVYEDRNIRQVFHTFEDAWAYAIERYPNEKIQKAEGTLSERTVWLILITM